MHSEELPILRSPVIEMTLNPAHSRFLITSHAKGNSKSAVIPAVE